MKTDKGKDKAAPKKVIAAKPLQRASAVRGERPSPTHEPPEI
jgi:hypothetical protein